MQYDVIVIGAGICGLTAAYRLYQAGLSISVLEQGTSIGGKIQTVESEGFLIEQGPNTFISKGKAIAHLCEELGLQPHAAAPAAKKRYLYHQGRLSALPTNPLSFLSSPLLSFHGKLRLLQEPWIPPRKDGIEESVADFTRRRLGDEVLDRFMGPFLSGIYAGDPEALSLPAVFPRLAALEQEGGSLTGGAWRTWRKSRAVRDASPHVPYRVLSFEQGMVALPGALAQALPAGTIRTNVGIEQILVLEDGFQVHLSTGEAVRSRGLLLAAPADMAADLLSPICPDAASTLRSISYVPLGVIHVGFKRSQIPHPLDGFGFLVPRKEEIPLLGGIWMSSLFPERAPEGQVLLTNMMGGALHPEIATWDEEQFLRQTCKDLCQVFKLPPSALVPTFSQVIHHTKTIPQYTLGHRERMKQAEKLLHQRAPQLRLSGNYLDGVSLNDCINQANQAADALKNEISRVKQICPIGQVLI